MRAFVPLSTETRHVFASLLIILCLVSLTWLFRLRETISGGNIIVLLLLVFPAILIIRQPYFGVVVTVASLTLMETLPEVPLATSVMAFIGMLTLAGYLVQSRSLPGLLARFKLRRQHALGLVFIMWFFFTAPTESLAGERNWLWTYIQLWILMWLASDLFRDQSCHRVLFFVFGATAALSAFFSMHQAGIGSTLKESARVSGLVGGANAAARYFVVAFVMLNFLREQAESPRVRLFYMVLMGMLIGGVVSTVSRTGLLLLLAAMGLLVFWRGKNTRRRRFGLVLVVFIVATLAVPDTYWAIASSFILQSIERGTDTVGLRYALWQAAIRMWMDHPIAGVGVGEFRVQLSSYGILIPSLTKVDIGAHNMYLAVLAEMGSIGLLIFVGILSASVNQLRALKLREVSAAKVSLASTWFVVLVVLLIGGITKHDQYDKLLWLTLGIAASLQTRGATALSGFLRMSKPVRSRSKGRKLGWTSV